MRPVSLRTLIIAICVVSVALAIALMDLAAYRVASQSLAASLVDLVTARSSAAAHTLDATFRAIQSVPLSNARFVETLPTLDETLFPRLLQATIRDHPDIYGATIALEPGVMAPGRRSFMPYVYQLVPGSTAAYGLDWVTDYQDPAKQYPGGPHSWYREGLKRPGLITWTLQYNYPIHLQSGKRIGVLMTTVETTISRHGRVVGVSTSDVTLDHLTRVAEGIRLGRRGYAILVDQHGLVLSHPRSDLRFGPTSRLADVRLKNPRFGALAAWSGRIFEPARATGAGVVRASPEVLVFRFEEAGRPMLAAATVVPSTGWRLIVVGDERELFVSLASLRNRSLWLALLASGGTGILIWGVLVIAFRPIQHLVRACELISSGRPQDAQALLRRAPLLATTYEADRLRQAIVSVNNYIAVTAELEHANMELKEGDRVREQILSNVSHNLKTPIMVIESLGESLVGGDLGALNDRAQEAVQQILHSAAGLNSLVNDLLDVSRIRAGRLELDLRPLDPAELTGLVVEELKPLAAEKHQSVSTTFSPGLPVLVADEQRLAQILTNLLSNAIKYTPEDGHIAVRVRCDADEIRWEVEDDGVGIAQEDLPKLFLPFSRVGDRSSHAGTGLGLNISKALVEAQGGRLGLQSELGAGSVFWFALPLTPRILERG